MTEGITAENYIGTVAKLLRKEDPKHWKIWWREFIQSTSGGFPEFLYSTGSEMSLERCGRPAGEKNVTVQYGLDRKVLLPEANRIAVVDDFLDFPKPEIRGVGGYLQVQITDKGRLYMGTDFETVTYLDDDGLQFDSVQEGQPLNEGLDAVIKDLITFD